MKTAIVISLLLGVAQLLPAFASIDELPATARKALDDGKLAYTIRHTWQEYHDKYATKTSGEPERADREQKWAALDAYAKHFWAIQKTLKVGESLHDYPGILAHGTTRWNSETRTYELILGLRPFDAGDGLGQFTVTFDLKGVISEIRIHKYPW